jgi:hypothetical protein
MVSSLSDSAASMHGARGVVANLVVILSGAGAPCDPR